MDISIIRTTSITLSYFNISTLFETKFASIRCYFKTAVIKPDNLYLSAYTFAFYVQITASICIKKIESLARRK